jgi:hypothetical protein
MTSATNLSVARSTSLFLSSALGSKFENEDKASEQTSTSTAYYNTKTIVVSEIDIVFMCHLTKVASVANGPNIFYPHCNYLDH